jgi:hypothetical protein
MPLADDQVMIGLCCGRDDAGRPWGHIAVKVDADALRRLGLHPDQPSSRVTGPSPPGWWHAAAERTWHGPAAASDGPRPRRRPRPS